MLANVCVHASRRFCKLRDQRTAFAAARRLWHSIEPGGIERVPLVRDGVFRFSNGAVCRIQSSNLHGSAVSARNSCSRMCAGGWRLRNSSSGNRTRGEPPGKQATSEPTCAPAAPALPGACRGDMQMWAVTPDSTPNFSHRIAIWCEYWCCSIRGFGASPCVTLRRINLKESA